MAREIIRTQTTKGTLIITEDAITLKFGDVKQQTLMISAFTSAENLYGTPSILGFGGRRHLIFHGQGQERLDVGLVKRYDAREIMYVLHMQY